MSLESVLVHGFSSTILAVSPQTFFFCFLSSDFLVNPLSYLPLCESGEDCVFRGKEKKISLSDSLVVFIHFSPSEPAGLSSLRLIGGWWTSNL